MSRKRPGRRRLAQESRRADLEPARKMLGAVGFIACLVGVVALLSMADNLAPEQRQFRLNVGVAALSIGGLFFALLAQIERYPVPATVTALAVAVPAGVAVVVLFWGVPGKGLIIFGVGMALAALGRAVSAARAFDRSRDDEFDPYPPEVETAAEVDEPPRPVEPPPEIPPEPSPVMPIGTALTGRDGRVLFAVLWPALAGTVVGLGVSYGFVGHALFAAAMPVGWSVVLWLTRGGAFRAEFKANGLKITAPRPEYIPYGDIEAVRAWDRPGDGWGMRHFGVQVVHDDGVLNIPACEELGPEELLSLFEGLVRSRPRGEPPAELAAFAGEDTALYGRDRVLVYRGRGYIGRPPAQPWKGLYLMTLLAFLGWGVVAASAEANGGDKRFVGWGVAGFIGVVVGFPLYRWTAGKAKRFPNGIPKPHACGLVVSPDGLALTQGKFHGEIDRDEVIDVRKVRSTQVWNPLTPRRVIGVLIRAEGTAFVIEDVFDRSPGQIYDDIRHAWGE